MVQGGERGQARKWVRELDVGAKGPWLLLKKNRGIGEDRARQPVGSDLVVCGERKMFG